MVAPAEGLPEFGNSFTAASCLRFEVPPVGDDPRSRFPPRYIDIEVMNTNYMKSTKPQPANRELAASNNARGDQLWLFAVCKEMPLPDTAGAHSDSPLAAEAQPQLQMGDDLVKLAVVCLFRIYEVYFPSDHREFSRWLRSLQEEVERELERNSP